jgi:hypothetical protein
VAAAAPRAAASSDVEDDTTMCAAAKLQGGEERYCTTWAGDLNATGGRRGSRGGTRGSGGGCCHCNKPSRYQMQVDIPGWLGRPHPTRHTAQAPARWPGGLSMPHLASHPGEAVEIMLLRLCRRWPQLWLCAFLWQRRLQLCRSGAKTMLLNCAKRL